MTNEALIEKVAEAICTTEGYEDNWDHPVMFMNDCNDTIETCREIYRDMARAAIKVIMEGKHDT